MTEYEWGITREIVSPVRYHDKLKWNFIVCRGHWFIHFQWLRLSLEMARFDSQLKHKRKSYRIEKDKKNQLYWGIVQIVFVKLKFLAVFRHPECTLVLQFAYLNESTQKINFQSLMNCITQADDLLKTLTEAKKQYHTSSWIVMNKYSIKIGTLTA